MLKKHATEKLCIISRNIIAKSSSMMPRYIGKMYQTTGKVYAVLECCCTATE